MPTSSTRWAPARVREATRMAAQRAAGDAPTPSQVRRVTAALVEGRAPTCLARGEFRGWQFAVHESAYVPDLLAVWASRPGQAERSDEVPDLAAARAWVGNLPAC